MRKLRRKSGRSWRRRSAGSSVEGRDENDERRSLHAGTRTSLLPRVPIGRAKVRIPVFLDGARITLRPGGSSLCKSSA